MAWELREARCFKEPIRRWDREEEMRVDEMLRAAGTTCFVKKACDQERLCLVEGDDHSDTDSEYTDPGLRDYNIGLRVVHQTGLRGGGEKFEFS